MENPINIYTLRDMSERELLDIYETNCENVALYVISAATNNNPKYDLAVELVKQTRAEILNRINKEH